ncbi:MAG TPA: hypothetical protein VHQ45_13275 [Gemmatimonadaceae bacterium]|jgi:hypothetical protein|nr:hypothetical protein [Gemmatimonadaceae bacterium]
MTLAAASPDPASPPPSHPHSNLQPAAPTTHLLLITGAGGEPQYRAAFLEAGASMVDAALRLGLPKTHVTWLAEDPARDPARISARSDRAGVERAFAALASQAGPADQVLVLLVGHGSAQGDVPRFNLPGPDLAAGDFARLLAPVKAGRVAFVNTASASGGFVPALSAHGRVVITATKSGAERNGTRFGTHFVRAYAADGADVDKDGRVSLLEAYTFARRETASVYERDRRLLTEHAQLDDDGDGTATAEPDGRTGDGQLARAFFVGGRTVARAGAAATPESAALEQRKAALEQRIADLRARKSSMAADVYERELEQLLVQLAQVNRQLRGASR